MVRCRHCRHRLRIAMGQMFFHAVFSGQGSVLYTSLKVLKIVEAPEH